MKRLRSHLARLRRCDAGGPIVEFGMVLPLILLFIALVIEGGRITWIHQATAAGVRDASRMIARIAPPDACATGGSGVGSYSTMAQDIVINKVGSTTSILPLGASLTGFNVTCHLFQSLGVPADENLLLLVYLVKCFLHRTGTVTSELFV